MKKNIALLISCLLVTAVLFYACKKDKKKDINLNVTAVSTIFAPADNKYIKLNPAANLTETFEWDQAQAEDGSLVLYEVAFDQENGDFSKPIYTIVSNGRGLENKLTLTHGQLSQIAALGGSDFFQRKKFKWTVYSTKGTNSVKASVTRLIDLERPGGFAVIPGTVYITGSATEGGTNLAQALKMRQLSAGVFEIFTKLKAGTYKFVDGITGTPKEFSLQDNAGVLVLTPNGTTTVSGADKVMRITINFNDVNGKTAEVKSMQLWYCQGNTFWFTLPYTSNGEWRYNNWVTTLITVPWGREERYKYKMVINDGTGDKDLWVNSTFGDPPGQDGQYPSTPAYRTVNLDKNDASQYDWGWKFDRNYLTDGASVNYWVWLRGSDAFYTQNYQKN